MFNGSRARRAAALLVCLAVLFVLAIAIAHADDAPRLDGPKCLPTAGTTDTVFRYSIVYYGATEPSGHDVHIDGFGAGDIHSMSKIGPGPSGQGSLYVYETKLPVGNHQYRFHFQVGSVTLRKPGPTGTDWYHGPTVTAGTATHTISGLIKASDVGLAGVEVHLTGAATLTVKTNAEGRYTFAKLKAGAYTVTPSLAGYRMDPLSRQVTVPAGTTTCNFRAIKQ